MRLTGPATHEPTKEDIKWIADSAIDAIQIILHETVVIKNCF